MEQLSDTWLVRVISGPLWFRMLNLLRNRKVIYGDRGHNVARKKKWGKFTITKEGDDIILKYKDLPIIDIINFLDKDKLSGEFYLMMGTGSKKYIGDFDMVRSNNRIHLTSGHS